MKASLVYFLTFIYVVELKHNGQLRDRRQQQHRASIRTLPEDAKLNFTQLASKYGHKAVQYDVVTRDGYIISVFRLPGEKPPVLLFHGMADSSDAFIIRGNISLAITLADAGYDVWVGNNRGNKYGRRHVKAHPDADRSFWDYSFHEIGIFDLATTIDLIRDITGKDSISTISHCQGTTAHYALASTRPEYNSKIKVSIALAPIAFLNNLSPPVSLTAQEGPSICMFLKRHNVDEVMRNHQSFIDINKFICDSGIASNEVCVAGVLFPFSGFRSYNVEPDFIPVAMAHYPSSTSRKTLEHFNQIVLSKRFSQYNNYFENSSTPLDYDLNAVKMNVALLVGKGDILSTIKDVEHLRDSLPNVVHYEVLEPEPWSHGDFLLAKDMPEYLYPSIFKILKKYN